MSKRDRKHIGKRLYGITQMASASVNGILALEKTIVHLALS